MPDLIVTEIGQVLPREVDAQVSTATTSSEAPAKKTSRLYRIANTLFEVIPPTALAGAAIQVITTEAAAPTLMGVGAAGFFVKQGVRHHQRREETFRRKNNLLEMAEEKLREEMFLALKIQHFPKQPDWSPFFALGAYRYACCHYLNDDVCCYVRSYW